MPDPIQTGTEGLRRTRAEFALRGWGVALPEGRLNNGHLGATLGVDPASITTRTGIAERRIAGPHESASTLGAAAARVALARAGCAPGDVDLVLLSTYTPDRLLCPTAPRLAHAIGATNAGGFDLNGACTGGVTALLMASSLIESGVARTVLVVASELTTRYVRNDDPKTRLLFGDGAAALLLQGSGRRRGRL